MRTSNKFRIIVLGQCIATGAGVDENSAYPGLTARFLSTRFPELSFEMTVLPLLHPTGLKALVASCLPSRPDVILISLPAVFACIPYRANQIYLQAPEIMQVARKFVMLIESKIRSDSGLAKLFGKRSSLMPSSVIAPLTVPEYRRLIEEAVVYCRSASECRLVLLGPGGFNEDAKIDDLKSPELCSEINQMIMGVGEKYFLPVINAHDWATSQGGKVFQRGTHRWRESAHEVMAREIESVIASQVCAMGKPAAKDNSPGNGESLI
jgi:hypothetical protein